MHGIEGVSSWITFTWWAILILIAILIIRYFVRRNKHPDEAAALKILKERLDNGEIDAEEYEKLKKRITD